MKSIKKLIYGSKILHAIQRDDLLRKADSKEGLCVHVGHPMGETDREFWQMVCLLRKDGLIEEREPELWRTTEDGKLFLASGGYTGEAKRNRAAEYALPISLTAIIISLVSLVAGWFGWFGRS